MVQRGRRAVYEPDAHAWEKPTPTNETEYRRKVRMFEHCWLIVLRGRMMRRLGPLYWLEIVSHRLLRYGSGILHVVLLATSIALVDARLVLRRRARGAAAAAPRGARGCRHRALLRARHVGDARRARQLPPPRRARHLGRRGRDAVNRALDVAIAGVGLVVTSPVLALGAVAVKLEDGGPVLYRQTRVGKDGADFELLKLRTMVVGAERQGAGFAVDRGDTPDHAGGPAAAPAERRRAAAALERRPRRHVGDRPAADAPLPGRRLRRAPAPPPRREAGHHRLGADPRPRRRCRGPSGSSSTSGTCATTTGRPTS